MNKNQMKLLLKVFIGGCIWCVIAIGIGIEIRIKFGYNLNDVIFVEGILLIIIGLLSSMGGNPSGLYFQGLGNLNAQYVSNLNIEITKKEREKAKNMLKTTISIGCSTMTLVIGGIFSIIINIFI